MKSIFLPALLTIAAASAISAAGTAFANEPDRKFFKSVEGNWAGPGEIVAGKYKGTKFSCTFTGSTPDQTLGMTLDGGCRVGVFTQKMTASVESRSGSGYRGTFLDGASGKGLDIVSGNVVDGQKVVLAINRKQLKGVMQARIANQNTMNVTVSVRVAQELVPVIGMSLKRVDGTSVGTIAGQ